MTESNFGKHFLMCFMFFYFLVQPVFYHWGAVILQLLHLLPFTSTFARLEHFSSIFLVHFFLAEFLHLFYITYTFTDLLPKWFHFIILNLMLLCYNQPKSCFMISLHRELKRTKKNKKKKESLKMCYSSERRPVILYIKHEAVSKLQASFETWKYCIEI